MRKIGLAALTVLELSHEDQVCAAADAGYDCVGLRLIPVEGQPYLHALDLQALERSLADTGIRVLDVEVFRLGPKTRVTDFEPILAVSARLGASELLVHGADPDEARLIDNWARLCELAAAHRLAPNLEPMPWVDVATVAKASRIVGKAGKSNGAVLVDAIHFYRENNSLKELSSTATRYLQICDAKKGIPASIDQIRRQARADRMMPGEGELDLRGLLAALPADLPVSVEVPYARPMPALERARLALRRTRDLL